MGYIRHQASIALFSEPDDAGVQAMQRLREEMPEDCRDYLLGPVKGINGYTTFVLMPDGSKEGWPPSDAMDQWREAFKDAALVSGFPTVVQLAFGGDDKETIIEYTTDSWTEDEQEAHYDRYCARKREAQSDPRDAEIARLRREVEAMRQALERLSS
jgi:hypothetical protein